MFASQIGLCPWHRYQHCITDSLLVYRSRATELCHSSRELPRPTTQNLIDCHNLGLRPRGRSRTSTINHYDPTTSIAHQTDTAQRRFAIRYRLSCLCARATFQPHQIPRLHSCEASWSVHFAILRYLQAPIAAFSWLLKSSKATEEGAPSVALR